MFKFERNISTETLNTIRCHVQKVPCDQEFARVRFMKYSKLSDEGRNYRTAGENGSQMMAMDMIFTHTGVFKT